MIIALPCLNSSAASQNTNKVQTVYNVLKGPLFSNSAVPFQLHLLPHFPSSPCSGHTESYLWSYLQSHIYIMHFPNPKSNPSIKSYTFSILSFWV